MPVSKITFKFYLYCLGILLVGLLSYSNLISCPIVPPNTPTPGHSPTIGPTSNPIMISLYVDAMNGNDTWGDGSAADPYLTITKALSFAAVELNRIDRIYVRPGTYNTALGEIFPLVIPAGIKLKKADESEKPIIEGNGAYTISTLGDYNAALVGFDNSSVHGFTIHSIGGIGVYCPEGNMSIIDNDLENCDYGILSTGSASPAIADNHFTNNTVSGIETYDSSTPQIRSNTIETNTTGIMIRGNSNPNIGTETTPGGNNIWQNSECDLCNKTANNVSAYGNTWDVSLFALILASDCMSGADIAAEGTGTVYFMDQPPENILFDDTTEILLYSPASLTTMETRSPDFSWQPTNNTIVMIGLFNEEIIISTSPKSIGNPEHMIWMWHSGLDSGNDGNVNLSDGKNTPGGNIQNPQNPVPLEKGKVYYWAVWAWGSDGRVILYSSRQNCFIISNTAV